MELLVQEGEVPKEFRDRVGEILNEEGTGDEIKRIWGKTKFEQYFVLVISKVVWYVVRVIVDEEYWYYPVVSEINVDSNGIFEKKQLGTIKKAEVYIEEILTNISSNNFDQKLRYRLRKVPKDVFKNPDKYLKKGTQIQRYLNGSGGTSISIGMLSHEGFYLGNCKVAHMASDDGPMSDCNGEAQPIIDTLEKFIGDANQELRIVDHCFRQHVLENSIEIATKKFFHQENTELLIQQEVPKEFDDCADEILEEESMGDEIEESVLQENMALRVQREEVPKEFCDRVDEILEQKIMGDEIERIWAKTNFGQYFVFVISEVVWYAVRLIVDEEYSNYPVVYHQNVDSDGIFEKKQFLTFKKAKLYIKEKLKAISKDKFDENLRFRVRKIPQDVLKNPDKYLKKGSHIQRYLKGELAKAIGIGSHEGVYLGNGKVAHISGDDGVKLSTKHKACRRIDTLEKFLDDPNQELRVVDHCFRQKSPDIVVEIAKVSVATISSSASRPTAYNLLLHNCQHFATFCVIGFEKMTELRRILKHLITPEAVLMWFQVFLVGIKKLRSITE